MTFCGKIYPLLIKLHLTLVVKVSFQTGLRASETAAATADFGILIALFPLALG